MLIVGILLGYLVALVTFVPLLVWFDRRAEARDRLRLRVDQQPQPMPGAYEPVRPRALQAAHTGPVFDGTPIREDDPDAR